MKPDLSIAAPMFVLFGWAALALALIPITRFIAAAQGKVATFERELTRKRTKAGLAAAKARGRKGGRRLAVTPGKLGRAKAMMRGKGLTVREAAGAPNAGKTALHEAPRMKESAGHMPGCLGHR
jgi:DNA invertase Pin-like site-specific DNA recombinase